MIFINNRCKQKIDGVFENFTNIKLFTLIAMVAKPLRDNDKFAPLI